MKNIIVNKHATLSLISISLTGITATFHYVNKLGLSQLVSGVVMILLPSLLMLWFERTGNKIALWIYGLLSAFIILGLGFVDGFLDHTVRFSKTLAYNFLLPMHGGDPKIVEKVFSLLPPAQVDVFLESTGVLTFIVSLFALYYAHQFIKGTLKNDTLK